jgi:hypothetical protein
MKQDKAPLDSNQKGSKSLKARVRKHLTDKNDVITEEDLKNIKIHSNPEDPEDAKELAESLKKKAGTPWDILREDIK